MFDKVLFAMFDTIEKLRKTLPERLPIAEYCRVTGRGQASAYNDLHAIPDLGVKVGERTFFLRDIMLREMKKRLDEMANPPPWVPQKDRAPRVKAVPRKRSTRPKKQTAAAQTDEVRQ